MLIRSIEGFAMPARSSPRPVSFRLHALALVAIGVLAACSKEAAPTAAAPLAAASDVAASDAMMAPPAPAAVATQAPVAVANSSQAPAPIAVNPPPGNEPSYVNESTNAPSYADDAQYANDDQQQVVSVYVDPPEQEPAPIAVDWAPPPMLVEDVSPQPYPDAVASQLLAEAGVALVAFSTLEGVRG